MPSEVEPAGQVDLERIASAVRDILSAVGEEVWWRKPVIPGNTTCELLDVPDDNGKQLSISWIPSSVSVEDLLAYWIFIDEDPITNIMNGDGTYRIPDFNISKEEDQFFNTTDRYIISSYHGGELQNVLGRAVVQKAYGPTLSWPV